MMMTTAELSGTGSWRRTRCAWTAVPAGAGTRSASAGPVAAGAPMARSVAAGSVIAGPSLRYAGPSLGRLRAEPEDLGPEDDDAEEDGVQQDVVVAGADVAAEHGLGHADGQADEHGAARLAERGEPRRDHPDEADRGAAHEREPGQRRLHDAEQGGQHRRPDEDPPPKQPAVDADDPRAEHALAAGARRAAGHGEAQVGPQQQPADDRQAEHQDAGPLHV